MTTERFTEADGRVRERQVKPDARRELHVAQVVSLSPPTVAAYGRRWRVHARTVGLTVDVGDSVLVCRVEQGAIVMSKVETI